MASVPVIYVAWDVLMIDDDVLIDAPLRERRERLEALMVPHRSRWPTSSGCTVKQRSTGVSTSASTPERRAAAQATGIDVHAGRRGFERLKLKRPLDTLDVVVVGAERGHGKRRVS